MSGDALHSELQVVGNEDEQAFIQRIKARIEELIADDINLLFSYLYRLDIEEYRIKELIKHVAPEHFSESLAKEIWMRQKERARLKLAIKVDPIQDKTWEL